jgi:hypothetical protein
MKFFQQKTVKFIVNTLWDKQFLQLAWICFRRFKNVVRSIYVALVKCFCLMEYVCCLSKWFQRHVYFQWFSRSRAQVILLIELLKPLKPESGSSHYGFYTAFQWDIHLPKVSWISFRVQLFYGSSIWPWTSTWKSTLKWL